MTLGVTEHSVHSPLKAIRRLMLESNGVLTVGLRRMRIDQATVRPDADLPGAQPTSLNGRFATSPWCHIEPAMAYQVGLPILVLREQGVLEDGLMEPSSLGQYLPGIDLNGDIEGYLRSAEWRAVAGQWEGYVRAVADRKGNPPHLF